MPRSCGSPESYDVADDNKSGGNTDPRLQRRARFQCSHGRDQIECGSNRSLRVVLVGLRITKINDGCVAVPVGDESVVLLDRLNDAVVIVFDNLPQILRVHSGGRPKQQLA